MNKVLFYVLFVAHVVLIFVSGVQFEVGGEVGWRKPTAKERMTYNGWAALNRFRIGDTLHFTYAKDSVMVVSSDDYSTCNTSNPIAKLVGNANAVYEFDQSGLFYFISGQPGHCKSGQRLIVRVMHPSAPEIAPAPAPAPAPGGDSGGNSGSTKTSSAAKLSDVSFFISAVTAPIVLFYQFM